MLGRVVAAHAGAPGKIAGVELNLACPEHIYTYLPTYLPTYIHTYIRSYIQHRAAVYVRVIRYTGCVQRVIRSTAGIKIKNQGNIFKGYVRSARYKLHDPHHTGDEWWDNRVR